MRTPFTGSYEEGDVDFLLKLIEMETTGVAEKERAIQSGARHYSEMLSVEKSPTAEYLALFHRALALNGNRFAADIARLVKTLSARRGREVVLVSLARAGTPVGVLVLRGLKHLGRKAVHYSVSIIRDRGIDWNALDYILGEGHADTDIVFLDGWTGKGVISRELAQSVLIYNASRGTLIDPALTVVADLAGTAELAATGEDYLIPNAVLNATVSGLISRTVLNPDLIGKSDFHGTVFYQDKLPEDQSRFYVDTLTPLMLGALQTATPCHWSPTKRNALNDAVNILVADLMQRYNTDDPNHIKIGSGESTRALLRRVPDRLILQDSTANDVQHLIALADEKRVIIEVDRDMPVRAAVVIKSVGE